MLYIKGLNFFAIEFQIFHMSIAILYTWKQFFKNMASKPSSKYTAYWWKNRKTENFWDSYNLENTITCNISDFSDFSQQPREMVVAAVM